MLVHVGFVESTAIIIYNLCYLCYENVDQKGSEYGHLLGSGSSSQV